jgi:hypothetical protein
VLYVALAAPVGVGEQRRFSPGYKNELLRSVGRQGGAVEIRITHRRTMTAEPEELVSGLSAYTHVFELRRISGFVSLAM